MIGLSLVKSSSKSQSLNPCGCSLLRLQLHEVDDIDDPDFQVGQVLAHNGDGGERFQRGTSPQQAHDHVGRAALVVAGPRPDADASVQCLTRRPSSATAERVFTRDHDVDVMAAAQAVVHHRQQAIRVGRKVDTDDLSFLVHERGR